MRNKLILFPASQTRYQESMQNLQVPLFLPEASMGELAKGAIL